MRGIARDDKDGAARMAKIVSSQLRGGGAVPLGTGETVSEWYKRYHAYQVELGQTDAVKKRCRFTKWIEPKIGHKPIDSVTRNDVEDLRDALDVAIAAWKREGAGDDRISGKTAMNAWSCLTSSFKAATSSKRRDLRVLDGRPNPCVGVEPPGDRESRRSRRKTFLYPKEASALFACEDVPIEWREIYALATYLYLRPGELRVLTWADVLESGAVNVTKAWDYEDKKIKTPKTRNGVRKVPIEPALVPLLESMRGERKGIALVAPALSAFGEDHLAEQFRKHLKLAKIDRAELHGSTRTHVQANFRTCRDSGITWLAISGLGVDKIMRRAGHDMIMTTMGYVKQAEDLTGDLGTPFGPLPPPFLELSKRFGQVLGNWADQAAFSREIQCRRRELKPSEERSETLSEDAPSPDKKAGSAIDEVPSAETTRTNSSPSEPERSPSIETLRQKLDAAIVAEAWDAVKAIRERMTEVERARAGNVSELAEARARRGR